MARPTSLDELKATLGWARKAGMSVTPRGAGSAMDGSNVGPGMILDLTAFESGRCEIDRDRRCARVSPAHSLGALNAAAAPDGLRFPVDPSSADWATLGGMISTNASGPRTVRSGSVRRWVQRVDLLTGDGVLQLRRDGEPDAGHPVLMRWRREVAPLLEQHADLIRSRYPAVRKNSAGYALDHYLRTGNLLDIVVGSEGTLGVITDVEVELEAVPAASASLFVVVRHRRDLGPLIESIRTQDPAAIELLDRSFLQVVAVRAGAILGTELVREAAGLLLVEFEGESQAVGNRAHAAAELSQPFALDARVAVDPAEVARLWSVRHGASPALAALTDGRRSLQVIEDGCVPVERLSEYLDAIDAAARAQRVDAVMFGHAGDGHVHVNLLPNLRDSDWKQRVRAVYQEVSAAVIQLGGTPSGEHGAGRLRAGLLPALYGPEVMACFRAIKQAFDPDGIFNPGVIIADGFDPLGNLKVGEDVPPLPEGVDEYLQRIEAGAKWATSRWG